MIFYLKSFIQFCKIFVLAFAQSKKGKGRLGEAIVEFLNHWASKNDWVVLNNVTLKLSNNDTTQIDHILISKNGIYIVETKNFSGNIYGGEKDKEWIQSFGQKKYKFQNPLFQNYKHIKAIEEITGINPNKIKGLIVFMANANLKNRQKNVFYPYEYLKYIQSLKSTILSKKEIEEIVKKIKETTLKQCKETDELHIKNIKNKQRI